MKLDDRTQQTFYAHLGPRPKRCRAAQHHPHFVEREVRGRGRDPGLKRHGYGSRHRRESCGQCLDAGCDHSACADVLEIVRKLPDGAQVELEAPGDGKLTIRAGRSRFTLSCLPTEDFPVMSGGEYAHTFNLPAGDLRELDRPHALCHLDRGNPLLSERYLSARVRA